MKQRTGRERAIPGDDIAVTTHPTSPLLVLSILSNATITFTTVTLETARKIAQQIIKQCDEIEETYRPKDNGAERASGTVH